MGLSPSWVDSIYSPFFAVTDVCVILYSSIDKQKRFLFIVYTTAFKIWDCTDLESLDEVLSIKTGRSSVDGSSVDPEWTGRVIHATILPGPRRKGAKDPFRGDRPLIGVL
jgi:hypothetical protein